MKKAGKGNPRGSRPNVLFVLTDDQQFDSIGALGNPNIYTPNIDRLVEHGTAFRRAYIMGGNKPAVCCPSRAMLLTGRSLYRTGQINRGPLSEKYETMPETFRKAGYRTFATGKQHNGPGVIARGFSDAGSLMFGGMGHHMSLNLQDFDPTGRYDSAESRKRSAFSTEIFTEEALGFLDRIGDDESFFAYVAYTAPHDPLMVPDAFRAMYDPSKMPLPTPFLPEHPFDRSPRGDRVRPLESCRECLTDAVVSFSEWPITEDHVREITATYYAMISHIDNQVGLLISKLEERGVLDNTIVVFASDNGIAMGRHGCYHKQTCYDHDVHIPLVMSGPGVSKGVESDALTYLFDCYPTLCDLTGLKTPVSVEGESLKPVFDGIKEDHRESLYFAYCDTWRGVYDGEYKLLEYSYDGDPGNAVVRRSLLYDLRNDPYETNDLLSDTKSQTIVEHLKDTLARAAREWEEPADRP